MSAHIRLVHTTLALLLVVAAHVLPAQQTSAEALLQEAMHHELIAGDLERAIALYRNVVSQYAANRSIVARALSNLGRTYEKRGAREARAVYERVVREFADQGEAFQYARARLDAMGSGAMAATAQQTLTMLMADVPFLQGIVHNPAYDYSPSGDQIVYSDNGAIVVVNAGTPVRRTLLPAQPRTNRFSIRWSPDGMHIAFMQRNPVGDSAIQALMVMPAGGGVARRVATIDELIGPARGSVVWTADSRALLTIVRGRLLTVDLEGRVLREAPMPQRYATQVTSISPDGNWLALHQRNTEQDAVGEMDVWLAPAAGGTPVRLIDTPGFDGWPVWAADGRSLYFVSDRSGSSNVWQVRLDPRTAQPDGEPERITWYADATVLHPKVVSGGKRLAFALMRTATAIHVATTDQPSQQRAVARGVAPQLSPDGRTVYFRSEGLEPAGVFAVPSDGGPARRLTTTAPEHGYLGSIVLSADGRTIAYFSRVRAENVLTTVNAATGETKELVHVQSLQSLTPSWSPDGTWLAYAAGDGLYVVAASGGSPERIAQLHAWEGWTVKWSPDGLHVAAFGKKAAGAENAVFVVPSRGGALRQLTPDSETGYKEGLEWHPDGRRLTYMYYGHDERGDETRVAYLDGSPTTRMFDQPAPIWDYVGKWRPDGKAYFITASDAGTWGLYVHDVADGVTRPVWSRLEERRNAGLPSFDREGRLMVVPQAHTTRQLWTIELKQ